MVGNVLMNLEAFRRIAAYPLQIADQSKDPLKKMIAASLARRILHMGGSAANFTKRRRSVRP